MFAWATMIVDRVPERGLAKAVESVVSGAEPCSMCLAVAEHVDKAEEALPERRKNDSQLQAQSSLEKLSSEYLAATVLPPLDQHGRIAWEMARFTANTVGGDVPTPPPRD